MKKIKLWCLYGFTLTLALLNSAHAADGVSQLKVFSKNVNSAQGDFLQQQIANQLGSDGKPKVLRQSSGQFIFVRPGKFVWTIVKPFEQKLLADGKQLVMWDKDLNQVTYRAANKALASTPAAILFGSGNLEEYFDLVNMAEKNGLAWVELVPKPQKNKIDDLPFNKIGIGLKDNLPIAMELRDALDNIVLLTFSQILVNRPIGNQEFVFNPPPGSEIVRLK
jgi:outer membrane lipoprotein carrier protein